jgi:flagellin-like protein
MNFQRVQKKNRKAISPVLATVILIAITLIAAIAIAGFVFGLFGSFTSTPQISGHVVTLTAAVANAAAANPTCGTSVPAAGASYIQFTNTGSANGAITSITFTYGGASHVQSAFTGSCTVASGGTLYVTETGIAATSGAVVGSQFTGTAITSSGGSVAFTGAFS